ncbi:MAG: hypothetical protein RLZZ45_1811, partial [Bacteroidota bacterium]
SKKGEGVFCFFEAGNGLNNEQDAKVDSNSMAMFL